MSIVWRKKKRYKRKTKYGEQLVISHKQRYTTQEETNRELISNTLEKDRLVEAQIGIQFAQSTERTKHKKRKKKGKRK